MIVKKGLITLRCLTQMLKFERRLLDSRLSSCVAMFLYTKCFLVAHHEPAVIGEALFGHASAGTPVYDEQFRAHPLTDHRMVQSLNRASQGLDEVLEHSGASAHRIATDKGTCTFYSIDAVSYDDQIFPVYQNIEYYCFMVKKKINVDYDCIDLL